MATPGASFVVPLDEIAVTLLSERELAPRARIIAAYAAQICPDSAVSVYAIDDQSAPQWKLAGVSGELTHEQKVIPFDSCTLGVIGERKEAAVFAAADLTREDYGHLNLKRSFTAIAYQPIVVEEIMVGAIEVVSYAGEPSEAQMNALEQLADVGAYAPWLRASAMRMSATPTWRPSRA